MTAESTPTSLLPAEKWAVIPKKRQDEMINRILRDEAYKQSVVGLAEEGNSLAIALIEAAGLPLFSVMGAIS